MRCLLLGSGLLSLSLLGACSGQVVRGGGSGGAPATTGTGGTPATTSSGTWTGSNSTGSWTTASSSSGFGSSSGSVSCGSAGSSSSGGTVDHCAGAIHLALGGEVKGNTCGGFQVGSSPCQEPGHPDVFVYVDAPPGTNLHLTASPGVSLLSFPTCQSDETNVCTFSSPEFDPPAGTFIFGVERVDTCCGDFVVGATGQ